MHKRSFSILNREADLQEIKKTVFDLVIIGGGITGAGIALDASSRGLNVLLLEKGDFASGTSSKSTKLIHGGLRYLKQFEFGLVRETGVERAIVHRLAPHLAIPEKMLLPFVKEGTYGSMSTSVGLKVYDFLANVVKKDQRQMLSKLKTQIAEPLLNKDIVEGGGIYSEYRTDDARLTLEILKTASRYEAIAFNYAEVTGFTSRSGRVTGVRFEDRLTGKLERVRSKCVVAAVGPWLDRLSGIKKESPKKLFLTKGIHLVVPHHKFPIRQPIYFDTPDERMVFAIPRGKTTYIGTTDTKYEGDTDRVVATAKDLNYLLGALARVFPKVKLGPKDVVSSWAGLRPLIYEADKSPSELSRKDEIFEFEDGLIAIAGGKLTGYRRMAERIVDLVQKRLDLPHLIRCRTAQIPLTESPFADYDMVEKAVRYYSRLASTHHLDPYFGWYLITTYGSQAAEIWRRFIAENDFSEEGLIKAELWYTVNYEMVGGIDDFFVRRTGRLYFDIESVVKHRELILYELAGLLNWNEEQLELQNKHLDQLIADATTYYDEEFSAS